MQKDVKISTKNIPILDNVLHYLKRLCHESVIKVQYEADKFESTAMSVKAHRYMMAIDGSASFTSYTYRKIDMVDAGVPADIIDKAYKDLNYVPEHPREILFRNKKKEIIDFYEEINPYYKALHGEPASDEQYIYLSESEIPEEIRVDNPYIPIHLYSDSELDLLYYYGVIDELIMTYPKYKYLRHLGSKRISIYNARNATNFSLLYYPTDVPSELIERFKDKLNVNKLYIESVVHSEAYAFKSEHYESFLAVLLLILTVMDIVAEIPDMINKYEVFDIKMIKLIFENYDIDYFDEIPFHYQLAMVKNLHKLLKYKSTTINIIDICSIFGFDDIRVFKYYLLKEHKTDEEGNYIVEYDDDYQIDELKTYDLKFIKVPIRENIREYLNDPKNYLDYDMITKKDKLWDGGLVHEEVKRQIMKLEFNHYYSKYMSIDILNSISKMAFQMSYFYNILFDDYKVEEKLTLRLKSLATNYKFKLVDILSLLYSLGYRYRGVKDTIFDGNTKVLYVMGFNFEQDLNTLAENVKSKGYTLEDLGVSGWTNPSEILTMNQLIEVYLNNKSIHDHLIYEMDHAENKLIFDAYKMVYDALMITKYTGKMFTMSNGELASTYSEFVKDRDPTLYKIILEIDAISNEDERKSKITQYINDITYALSEYINCEELDHVFSIYPTVSRDAIRDYVKLVIDFFKSYKIDIESVNSVLKFDSTIDNKVRILDLILMGKMYNIDDKLNIDISDAMKYLSKFDLNDTNEITDFATIISVIFRQILMNDKIKTVDDINNIELSTAILDYAGFDSKMFKNIKLEFLSDYYTMKDLINKIISTFKLSDKINIDETVSLLTVLFKIIHARDDIKTLDELNKLIIGFKLEEHDILLDSMYAQISLEQFTHCDIFDILGMFVHFGMAEKVRAKDDAIILNINVSKLNLWNKIKLIDYCTSDTKLIYSSYIRMNESIKINNI